MEAPRDAAQAHLRGHGGDLVPDPILHNAVLANINQGAPMVINPIAAPPVPANSAARIGAIAKAAAVVAAQGIKSSA